MIISFRNKLAQALVEDQRRKEGRHFPPELWRAARKKLAVLHAAKSVMDLKVPPGNRLEMLKGARKGFYSIRINDQWRICFQFEEGNAYEVSVEDYHS